MIKLFRAAGQFFSGLKDPGCLFVFLWWLVAFVSMPVYMIAIPGASKDPEPLVGLCCITALVVAGAVSFIVEAAQNWLARRSGR